MLKYNNYGQGWLISKGGGIAMSIEQVKEEAKKRRGEFPGQETENGFPRGEILPDSDLEGVAGGYRTPTPRR